MNLKSLILTFFVFLPLISLFLPYNAFPCYLVAQSRFDSNYIVLIDLNTMICPVCINSIEGALNDLKMKKLDKVIGIVVCDKPVSQSERNLRIVNKQIMGFKTGFKISFPVYFDSNGLFSSLHGNGISLIELNNKNNLVIKKHLTQKKVKL